MKKHLAASIIIQTSYRRYKIHKLDVSNSIKEKLIKSLKDEELDLSRCNINDDILIKILPLLSILNITNLDLSNNHIEPEGALALAKTLETNKSIKKLNLSCNFSGDDGAKKDRKSTKNKHITQRT